MEREKALKKITLEYDNGEVQEIDKGFIVVFSDYVNEETGENEVSITYSLANISGRELKDVVSAVLLIGDKFGMFDGNED